MTSLFLYFAPEKASCKFADAAHSDGFQLLHSTYLSPAEQLGWVISNLQGPLSSILQKQSVQTMSLWAL